MIKYSIAAISILLSTGCDQAVDYVDNLTCAYIPFYVADCTSPEVHDKAVSVLTDGAVEAQINCQGFATNSAGKFVSVYYQASRLQDGGCHASSTIAGPSSIPGGGFVLASGSNLTPRSSALAYSCPVAMFTPPMTRSTVTVVGGTVVVEGPFCTNPAGSPTCSMPVANNCTGLNTQDF